MTTKSWNSFQLDCELNEIELQKHENYPILYPIECEVNEIGELIVKWMKL